MGPHESEAAHFCFPPRKKKEKIRPIRLGYFSFFVCVSQTAEGEGTHVSSEKDKNDDGCVRT